MKTKYPSMFGLLAVFMLVAALVIPANLANPAPVEADPGICKWDTLGVPGAVVGKRDIANPSEVNTIYAGPDNATVIATVNVAPGVTPGAVGTAAINLWTTGNNGINWSGSAYSHLLTAMAADNALMLAANMNVWDAVIAPDDAKFWAVVTSDNVTNGPVNVWITENGGGTWQNTQLNVATAMDDGVTEPIGCIDISPDYGGQRDIGAGLRTGANGNPIEIWVVKSKGFGGWQLQTVAATTSIPVGNTAAATNADIEDLKFSPTYVGDAAMAVVFSMPGNVVATDRGTFYNVALRDLATNAINQWAFPKSVEVRDPNDNLGDSPDLVTIVSADLELPSDFSGQSASLRRAYVSIDDGGLDTGAVNKSGIFRMDDQVVYELMDTSGLGATGKRIATIAYYGTYASGKLLAGEMVGFACTATVPTWFTDSPTTCPIPCWYPALKPTTGAAGQACIITTTGDGAAQVDWRADGQLGYVGTGNNPLVAGAAWFGGLLGGPVGNDESAFAITRNNGETWNQLGIIDTTIDWFNDVAPSADCTTLYLTSVNNNLQEEEDLCFEFDSVWRTSSNDAVTAPLAANPVGTWYERVYCRVTAVDCEDVQSDLPIIRLAPDKTDGEVVGWAAQCTQAQAWSPDFGDYWAIITPRVSIQDFVFESSTLMYDLCPLGMVQKLPYTGTAWSTALGSVDCYLGATHMITAQAEGKVLVGSAAATPYKVAYSLNAAESFGVVMIPAPTAGNYHVAFHPAFDDNAAIFAADDAANGTVYRNTIPAAGRWQDLDMMAAANNVWGCNAPHPIGQFGLQLASTGANNDVALYSAHDNETVNGNSAVCRTLWPLWGMPKPGMWWGCLDTFQPAATSGVQFTLEPWSLKKCGCLTMDTDTTLYALDDESGVTTGWSCPDNPVLTGQFGADPGYTPGAGRGLLWGFTDCMAKRGPTLVTEDGTLIGCDPVSGRNQEVNLCWEQLCLAQQYDIEVAKLENFSIKVIDWVGGAACTGFFPASVFSPCCYIPAGGLAEIHDWVPGGGASEIAFWGNLECGHTYYWHVMVVRCATGQSIISPWSETRSFTIKAGLPVRADYYGIKLLAPDNGCMGCAVSPASFSWAPFKETTKYKFVLAKDAALTDVLAEAETATTAYEYDGTLDYSTNYFWRVMSVEPAPSDWSATFSFQTEAAPLAPPAPAELPSTPMWVWIIIGIGAILVIVTLVLIFKTRRV